MNRIILFFGAILISILMSSQIYAEAELTVQGNFVIDYTPVDIAISPDGSRVYVLNDTANILIYSGDGELMEKVTVDGSVTGIKASPKQDYLFLFKDNNKIIQLVSIDKIFNIPSAGSQFKGAENADITMTLFSDFQCPFCAKLASILDKILDENSGRVKLVFKNYPLRNHAYAIKAAAASLAASRQGKYWEFHDELYLNYSNLNDLKVKEIAESMGLDLVKFQEDRNDPKILAQIEEEIVQGNQAGIMGTPSLFINGKKVRSLSYEGISGLIKLKIEQFSAKMERDGTN